MIEKELKKEMESINGKQTKTVRNSNLEFIRIIAMFMVVVGHCTGHGALDPNTLPLGFNKLLIDSLKIGKLGVIIFVIITGYFLSQSKFNYKRIVNVILQTVTYSATIFIGFCIIDSSNFSIMEALTDFFPVMMGQYWFVTAYIILSLFMPFINKTIENINRKEFIILLVVSGFFFSVAPSVLLFNSVEYGGFIAAMIYYYLIGAYLRKYPDNVLSKKNAYFVLAISSILLIFANVCRDILGINYELFIEKIDGLYSQFSVFFILIAISLFSIFANMKPYYNKFINAVGGCTFGVYLIHDHDFIRNLLWKNIFSTENYANSCLLVVRIIYSTIIVFVVCSAIEFVRKNVVEKYILKYLYKFVYSFVDCIVEKSNNFIKNTILKGKND